LVKTYISKYTYLIEEALAKIIEFTHGPHKNSELGIAKKALEDFLKINEIVSNDRK
jgi:hypothetical protein